MLEWIVAVVAVAVAVGIPLAVYFVREQLLLRDEKIDRLRTQRGWWEEDALVAKKKRDEYKEERDKLKADVEAQQAQIEGLLKETRAFPDERAKKNKEIFLLQDSVKSWRGRATEAEGKIAKLKEQVQTARNEAAANWKLKAEAKSELEKAAKAHDALQKELDDCKAIKGKLAQQVSKNEIELQEQSDTISHQSDMIASLTTEKEKLHAEKSKQGSRIGGLERSIRTKEKWIADVVPLMKSLGIRIRSGRPVEAEKIARLIESIPED